MSRSVLLTSAQKHWQLTIALTIWVCEFIFALVLFARWRADFFAVQPMFWFGAFVTLLLAVAAVIARRLAHQNKISCGCCSSSQKRTTIGADLLTILPSVVCGIALLPLGFAISVSFLILLTLLLCVATFFVAESSHLKALYYLNVIMWGESVAVPANQSHEDPPPVDHSHEIDLSLEERLLQQTDIPVEINGQVISHPENITQSITRQVTEEGCEIISGRTLVTVVAGAKQANVHIPFSPPLQTNPEVTCEIETGYSARVVPTAIYSYGTRLEVRLTEPAEEEMTMEVSFSATASHQNVS